MMNKINIGISVLVLAFIFAYLSRGLHFGPVYLTNTCIELGTKNIEEKIKDGVISKTQKGVEITSVDGSSTYDEIGKYPVTVNYVKDGQRGSVDLNVYIVDTTAPKVTLVKNEIYQNQNVDLDKIIYVQDSSNSSKKLSSYKYFCTPINNRTLGKTKFKLTVLDSSGNEAENEFEVEVKESSILIYDLVKRNCLNKSDFYEYKIDETKAGDSFLVTYSYKDDNGLSMTGNGTINFTKGTINEVSNYDTVGSDTQLITKQNCSFNDEGKISSFRVESGFEFADSTTSSVDNSIENNKSQVEIMEGILKDVAGDALDLIYGKTLEDAKNMKIDLSNMTIMSDEN